MLQPQQQLHIQETRRILTAIFASKDENIPNSPCASISSPPASSAPPSCCDTSPLSDIRDKTPPSSIGLHGSGILLTPQQEELLREEEIELVKRRYNELLHQKEREVEQLKSRLLDYREQQLRVRVMLLKLLERRREFRASIEERERRRRRDLAEQRALLVLNYSQRQPVQRRQQPPQPTTYTTAPTPITNLEDITEALRRYATPVALPPEFDE